MSDIFISYKREDRERAKLFAEFFAANGYDVWWDIELLPGDQFANEINAALNRAKATVVLWTSLSVKSDYVKAEASHSRERGILIPVLIEETNIPIPFNVLQTLNLTNWSGNLNDPLLLQLLNAVKGLVGEPVEKKSNRTEEEIQKILHYPAEEVEFWKTVIEKNPPSISEYQLYIDKYGQSGWFIEIALIRKKELEDENQTTSKISDAKISIFGIEAPIRRGIAYFFIFIASSIFLLLNFEKTSVQLKNINAIVNNVFESKNNETADELVIESTDTSLLKAEKEDIEDTNASDNGEESNSIGSYYKLKEAVKEKLSKLAESDNLAWKTAKEFDTINSYDYYLKNWPEGLFAEQAEKRLVNLKNKKIETRQEESVTTGWVVRVGTFSKYENTQNLIQKLKENDFDPGFEVVNNDYGLAFRLWVGPFEKRVTAAKTLETIKEVTGVKGYIRSYP